MQATISCQTLVRVVIEGDEKLLKAFKIWRERNRITPLPDASSNPLYYAAFYEPDDALKIIDWARANNVVDA